MNADDGAELVQRLGPQTKFFECNVLETASIQAAVDGTAEWIKSTGRPLAGVIPAAGVTLPATVGLHPPRASSGRQSGALVGGPVRIWS